MQILSQHRYLLCQIQSQLYLPNRIWGDIPFVRLRTEYDRASNVFAAYLQAVSITQRLFILLPNNFDVLARSIPTQLIF